AALGFADVRFWHIAGVCHRADECPLLGAKKTVTNRCLPISIYGYRASRSRYGVEISRRHRSLSRTRRYTRKTANCEVGSLTKLHEARQKTTLRQGNDGCGTPSTLRGAQAGSLSCGQSAS